MLNLINNHTQNHKYTTYNPLQPKNLLKTALLFLNSFSNSYAQVTDQRESIRHWIKGHLPPECKPITQLYPKEVTTCPVLENFPYPWLSKYHFSQYKERLNQYFLPDFQDLISPQIICPTQEKFREKEVTLRYSIPDHEKILTNPEIFKIYSIILNILPLLHTQCLESKNRVRCASPYDLVALAVDGVINIDVMDFDKWDCMSFYKECDLNERIFYSIKEVNHASRNTPLISVVASVTTQNDHTGAFELHRKENIDLLIKISKIYPLLYFTYSSIDDAQFVLESLNNHTVKVLVARNHGDDTRMQVNEFEFLTEENFFNTESIRCIAKDASIILDSCSTGKSSGTLGNMVQIWASKFPGRRVTGPVKDIFNHHEIDYIVSNNRLFFFFSEFQKDVSYSAIFDT